MRVYTEPAGESKSKFVLKPHRGFQATGPGDRGIERHRDGVRSQVGARWLRSDPGGATTRPSGGDP